MKAFILTRRLLEPPSRQELSLSFAPEPPWWSHLRTLSKFLGKDPHNSGCCLTSAAPQVMNLKHRPTLSYHHGLWLWHYSAALLQRSTILGGVICLWRGVLPLFWDMLPIYSLLLSYI